MAALVGRDTDLAMLCAHLERAAARLRAGRAGSGQPVLLGGPAGIGTSRLAAELMHVARARGVITLHGRPSGPALAPVLDALREHLDSLPSGTRSRLLAGVPALGTVLARISAGEDPQPATPMRDAAPVGIPTREAVPARIPTPGVGPAGASSSEDPVEHLRIADAVVRLVARLADRSAVLLVVDDAHRADADTIALLRHLAARLATRPVLVVLAHRTPSLAELGVEVRRRDPTAEVTLGPLPDAAMREIVGAAATDELLHRAAGVPLFALALAAGPGLPQIVRDAVREVLEVLDPAGRALFELIAVAGSATADLLGRAAPGSRAALRGLVATGLVIEDAEPDVPRFRPAHPLHAEVALAELLADEHRRLHAALAVALDADSHAGDVTAAAPHHLGGRGYVDPVRAGGALHSAGLAAAAERADVDAERYLRAAAGHVDDAGVLAALGHVSERLGRPADALAAWTRAIPLVAGDEAQSDALRVDIGSLEYEHGTAGSPGVDRSAEHAVVALLHAARFGDAVRIQAAAQRLIVFESAEGDAARAAAALGRAHLAMLRGDLAVARGHAQASVEHAHRCPGTIFAGIAERELARVALLTGDLAAARSHAQRNLDAGLADGAPRIECSGRVNLAMLHHLSGHMADALREAELGLAAGRLAGTPRSLARALLAAALLAAALLAADQGRARAAREQLTEAERVLPGGGGEAGAVALAEMTRVLLALGADRPQHVPPMSDWSYDSDPTVMCVRPFLAGRAQLAAGDGAGVEVSLGRLRGTGLGSPLLAAFADRLEGLAQRCDTGTDLLESAADALERMGVRLHAAQARLEWAERAAERGRPQARDATVAACEVFDAAGVTGWSDRGRRLARGMGLRVAPRRAATGPLTARESEVAGLVADGMSNADIAAALFVGERTVESHMAKIYRRLGLGSRVELAAWAARVRAGTDGPADPAVP